LNATTLVVGGIEVETAQVRLGHADPRMTLAIYASAGTKSPRQFRAKPSEGSKA
jgi:integrase